MTAYYDTLIVTFSDPIRILDRMTPINEHTAVITSEYNMVHVVEWLRKYTLIAEMKEY